MPRESLGYFSRASGCNPRSLSLLYSGLLYHVSKLYRGVNILSLVYIVWSYPIVLVVVVVTMCERVDCSIFFRDLTISPATFDNCPIISMDFGKLKIWRNYSEMPKFYPSKSDSSYDPQLGSIVRRLPQGDVSPLQSDWNCVIIFLDNPIQILTGRL